jgi:hypothetical protein
MTRNRLLRLMISFLFGLMSTDYRKRDDITQRYEVLGDVFDALNLGRVPLRKPYDLADDLLTRALAIQSV